MSYCLLINGSPIFYSSTVDRILGYVSSLVDKKDRFKSSTTVEIIGDYNEKKPNEIVGKPVLYKRCNRCFKMYSTPYFMTDKGTEGNACLHCREKRKAQYRGLYTSYNPVYVNNFIREKYGEEFVVQTNWINIDENAKPLQEKYDVQRKESGLSSPYRPRVLKPNATEKELVADKPVVKENPQNTSVAMRTNEAPARAEPKIRRWSYHYVYGLKNPIVNEVGWFYDYNDSVTAIQKGNRDWVDYSLVCYAKNRAEADEKIERFILKHSKELNSVEEIKMDFGWE